MAFAAETHPHRSPIERFVNKYAYVHLSITILGNAVFVAGSVLFLLDMRTTGTWAFLFGSSAMPLGSLGELVRWIGQHRLRNQHQRTHS